MHPHKECKHEDFDNMEDMHHIQFEDEILGQHWLELYATKILDVRYQWAAVKDVVDKQQHHTIKQRPTF